ncbi:hypothetical protein EVAR_36972_1 [Eumeta japonica]|uniref:Uncharacterized protein n=1 Tax=Eumeta variegata TaxID=151549 RepID=A0A4C1WAH3_EUMVA|nr:hypothetical protein EVAR_36972_1 [Eumeta japonica]
MSISSRGFLITIEEYHWPPWCVIVAPLLASSSGWSQQVIDDQLVSKRNTESVSQAHGRPSRTSARPTKLIRESKRNARAAQVAATVGRQVANDAEKAYGAVISEKPTLRLSFYKGVADTGSGVETVGGPFSVPGRKNTHINFLTFLPPLQPYRYRSRAVPCRRLPVAADENGRRLGAST